MRKRNGHITTDVMLHYQLWLKLYILLFTVILLPANHCLLLNKYPHSNMLCFPDNKSTKGYLVFIFGRNYVLLEIFTTLRFEDTPSSKYSSFNLLHMYQECLI